LHLKEAPKNEDERRFRRDNEHLDAAAGVAGPRQASKAIDPTGVTFSSARRSSRAIRRHPGRVMRHRAVLFATLVLAACTSRVTRSESRAVSPALEPVVQFLLTAAATDFHTHRPPDPVRFRDVRVGHVMTPSGEEQYMLCGLFLPAQGGGNAEWTPFATIKTSDYEQWIGAQAAGFCQHSSVIWDKEDDLSPSLQSRLDSLQ
jgi:hypothetical protein